MHSKEQRKVSHRGKGLLMSAIINIAALPVIVKELSNCTLIYNNPSLTYVFTDRSLALSHVTPSRATNKIVKHPDMASFVHSSTFICVWTKTRGVGTSLLCITINSRESTVFHF